MLSAHPRAEPVEHCVSGSTDGIRVQRESRSLQSLSVVCMPQDLLRAVLPSAHALASSHRSQGRRGASARKLDAVMIAGV
jgi:hypothetical protein